MTGAAFDPGMSTAGFFNVLSRQIWVAKGGSDTAGDGTLGNPFETINRACTEVRNRGDASTVNRYAVFVGPGVFDENLVMSDWTYIVGSSVRATRINFVTFDFGAEFALAVAHACGFEGLSFVSNLTVDFTTVGSAQGTIQFVNVRSTPFTVSLVAMSSSNQFSFENCILAHVTQTGGISNLWSCTTRNLTVNDAATFAAQCTCQSTTVDGTLILNSVAFASTLWWYGCAVSGMTTLNGALATIAPQSNPKTFRNGVTLLAGAPEPRFVLTGAKGGNAALTSVCTQLAASGGFVDNTT